MSRNLGCPGRTFLWLMMAILLFFSNAIADEFTLKLGSLGPAGTSATSIVGTLQDYLKLLASHTGHKAKLIPYYGGVMGDEPDMKASPRGN